jgi:hypothetical protein
MNEANVEVLDSDLLKDAEKTSQLPSLPPLAPDAPAEAAAPPPAENLETYKMQPLPAPSPVPVFEESTTKHRSEPPPPAARPSWIKSLLVTTFPPPGVQPSADQVRLTRRTAGAVFAVLGLAAAVVALVTGLRGAPNDPAIPPTVAAAIILARALIAVGAGTFSFALFRMSERLVTETR